jgi:methanogenic corrinoid protein MtbC1
VPEAEQAFSSAGEFDVSPGLPRANRRAESPERKMRSCDVAFEAPVDGLAPSVVSLRAAPKATSQMFDDLLVQEFVRVSLEPDENLARSFVDSLLGRGVSVQSIYLDLLAPAARVLGDMWDEDTCDFVEVTTAVGRLQLVLRDLSQMFVRDRPEEELAGRVLLACLPGEQHSLGLFMVAEFFVRDGWEVHVGPPLSGEALLADVRSTWYDIVGFSASCDSRLDNLKREIRRVRQASQNQEVLIFAGGRAFNDNPDLLARLGADGSAPNAELAPERARQLLSCRARALQ